MLKTMFCLLMFVTSLQAEVIDILSIFPISELFVDFAMLKENGIRLQAYTAEPYEAALVARQRLRTDKIFVWNYVLEETSPLFSLDSKRLIYFLFEPWEPGHDYYDLYSAVYTWNDDLVDGKKFFKIYYPSLMPMVDDLPAFEEKKFCTMVAGNWTQPRVQMVEFFESKPEGEFEFYGFYPYNSRMYRGAIPGFHSGKEKIEVLKQYRFCICFENSTHLNGYITEKIFCCFAAGCVPVYWGAPNVEAYIPKSCYVDLRDFDNREELYQYLKTMPKEVYERYLEDIREFLSSAEAQLFSPAYFNEVLLDACTRDACTKEQ